MMSFWKGRRQPRRVASDAVFPVNEFDEAMKDYVLRWMVRFNDVLDADKLHAALVQLLEAGPGWRRLGGRLRVNERGKRETHVPQAFDAASRPAVRFHHITTFADTDIGTHPLASRLPRATADGRSSVQACGDDFRHLGVPDWPSFPKRIDDYCYGADNDEPLLALLVMSFADATLVSLNVPHLVTDAMGLSAIVTNWCRMLAGREDEVVPLAPTATIDEVGAGKLYRSKEGDEEGLKVLVGWSFFLFALRFFLDIVLGPAMHTRTLFLSARTIEVLRRRTAADLVSRTEGGQPPFVSDGDIITAWGTRMVARGLGAGSQRRLTAMNVFELRSRLKTIFRPAAAYVQNTVFVSATDFSGPEARGLGDSRGEAATTLGDMALRVRHDLARQTAEPHVHTLVAAYRTSLAEQGRPAVVARSDGMPVIITNWCKARFYEVTDFGPAVVSGLEGQKGGTPDFLISFNNAPSPTMRNTFAILGKDRHCNYWVVGLLSSAAWAAVEADLGEM